MSGHPRPARLRVKRSAWWAWWQLLMMPGPLLIRVLIWSQRNARAAEAGDDIAREDEPEKSESLVGMKQVDANATRSCLIPVI